MFWSDETINLSLSILENSTTIEEACSIMSERLGTDVSRHALQKAFKRAGIMAPSHYLKEDDQQGLEATTGSEKGMSEEDASDVSEISRKEWSIDHENKVYRFFYKSSEFDLSFEEVEECCFLYSRVSPGKDLSAISIAQYLYIDKNHDWVDVDFVVWMFRRIGFSKKMYPQAPHQAFDSVEEIALAAMKRQDAFVKSQKSATQVVNQRQEIERLRKELTGLYSVLELDERLNARGSTNKFTIKSEAAPVASKSYHKIIAIGDVHAGKEILQRSFYKKNNTYNREEFYRRIKLIAEYISIDSAKNPVKPESVVFAGIGDWFESIFANMREGMHREMYGTPEEQYDDVIWAYTHLLERVCETYPSIPIHAFYVPGNHDRFHKNKEDRTEAFMAHILTDRIRKQFTEPNVHINKGGTVNSIMLPNGVNFIFLHGHVSPLSPSSNDKDYTNFCTIHGYPDAKRYIICSGHYHTFLFRNFINGKVLWVSSVCGNDYYSSDIIAKGGPAEFVILNSHEVVEELSGPYPLQQH